MKESSKPKVPPIFLINLILRVSNFFGKLKNRNGFRMPGLICRKQLKMEEVFMKISME